MIICTNTLPEAELAHRKLTNPVKREGEEENEWEWECNWITLSTIFSLTSSDNRRVSWRRSQFYSAPASASVSVSSSYMTVSCWTLVQHQMATFTFIKQITRVTLLSRSIIVANKFSFIYLRRWIHWVNKHTIWVKWTFVVSLDYILRSQLFIGVIDLATTSSLATTMTS